MKSARILFITGTDTSVGKTVFAALTTRSLRDHGFHVAALKPICSGGRDDARQLHQAAGKVLTLDEVNPWHFRAALSPVLAARQEKKRLQLRTVVAHIQRIAKRFEVLIVEGAGGLLSPLGEDFDSRDLIQALGAEAIIVCPNKLGAVNQVRLVLEALPRAVARQARVVLISPKKRDAASRTNPELLREFVEPKHLLVLPWISRQLLEAKGQIQNVTFGCSSRCEKAQTSPFCSLLLLKVRASLRRLLLSETTSVGDWILTPIFHPSKPPPISRFCRT